MKLRHVAIPLLAALMGCATQPITTIDAHPVQAAKVLDLSFTQPAHGKVEVIVKRDTGFFGSGCTYTLLVGNKPVVGIDPEQKVSVFLTPGPHVFGVRLNGGLCGTGLVETEIVVREEGPNVVRLSLSAPGQISISRTAN